MRTIIAGSRHFTDIKLVYKAIAHSGFGITQIISGCAKGIDTLGADYARSFRIPINYYPANWQMHGKSAGYVRNKLMADNADALIAIWDGISKGTKHMIEISRKKGLKTFVVLVPSLRDKNTTIRGMQSNGVFIDEISS